MNKIEHIGIAVRDLNEAEMRFEKLLGTKAYKKETVDSEGVTTLFFKVGETKIELLQATREDSAIAKYIEKRGEGIHHIAFDVDSVHDKSSELTEQGFNVLNENPKAGADGKIINFLHPKSSNGVLVELCQDKE